MLPYTTPTHRFKLPVDARQIEELYITYSQDGIFMFEKSLYDCEVIENYTKVQVTLTQEDTGRIRDYDRKVEVQMTFKTKEGIRYTSNVLKFKTGPALKREVI